MINGNTTCFRAELAITKIMNFRDRSPARMGQGPRFRPDFRPGFGRGMNNRNMDDRPRPMWKDDR